MPNDPEYMRAYRARNRDKIAARKQATKERDNARRRENYAKNPERIKAADKRSYYRNVEAHRAASRQWHTDHPGRQRAAKIQHKYGITPAQHADMFLRQNGCCAICRNEFGAKREHIDHDHANGAIRGLLCSGCNTGLGHFKDDTGFLAAAIEYLRRARLLS